VTVSLRETAIKRWTASIAVFRCPQCGCLILDDVYGWKGSGVVFRATPEMIDDYVKKSGQPLLEGADETDQ
jgi:hypothetical protein